MSEKNKPNNESDLKNTETSNEAINQTEASPENNEKLTDSADDLTKENSRLKDQLLRLAAEHENFRKRSIKDVEEANKYSITKFARDLIDVLENLHRAESSINTELLEGNDVLKNIFSGIELTKKSLVDVFERYGIKRVDPLGEQFNHDYHQAIMQVPSKTHKNGDVIQVIQAGYILNDRLLRPALVAVAKAEE